MSRCYRRRTFIYVSRLLCNTSTYLPFDLQQNYRLLSSEVNCKSNRMSAVKSLTELSREEFKEFINSFDNVFSDCDGVIWTEPDQAVPGVKETLSKLKKLAKNVRFVSNNNTRGMPGFYKKFISHGYDGVHQEDIAYPTLAMVQHLKNINFDKEIFVIGGLIIKSELTEAGFKIAELDKERMEENIMEIIDALKDNRDIGAVIIDFDLNVNYLKLLKATVYLRRPDVVFLKGGTDKKLLIDSNSYLIGHGCFQSIVEELTGREAINFGKPSVSFNDYLKQRFQINDPKRTLFVGDMMEQDMLFAHKCGYKKLLVLSGVSKLEDIEKCTNKDILPDFYVNSLGQLHELIDKNL